jgi:HEAT repeat protein
LLVSVLAFVFANWISSEAAAAGTTASFAAAAAVRAELLGSSRHDPRIELTQASPENAVDPRLQRLFDLLDSDDAMERASNLDTLSHIASQADTILPVMRARLKLSSPIRKSEAAWVIGSLSKGAAEDVTPLTELLSDPNVRVRAAAILALGQIGPAAAAALPALTRLPARDQNTDTTIKCLNGSDVSCRAARQAFAQQNPMLRLMLEQGIDPNQRPRGACMCSFLALRQGSQE